MPKRTIKNNFLALSKLDINNLDSQLNIQIIPLGQTQKVVYFTDGDAPKSAGQQSTVEYGLLFSEDNQPQQVVLLSGKNQLSREEKELSARARGNTVTLSTQEAFEQDIKKVESSAYRDVIFYKQM
ncbi:MAG: hypothetical protein AAGG80_07075, partial [Pseudomonadota bacterium]